MSNSQDILYQQSKPTERQLLSYHLLHTVRQVNGGVAFRAVAEQATLLRTRQRMTLPAHYQQEHFGYVLQGEVYVYKRPAASAQVSKYRKGSANPSNDKIFITNHKVHEIFALQEYPLNWKEQLHLQLSEGAKVLMLPLLLSLTSFRKILNTSAVQYRAQILKRCECFKDTQIDKLKKIALYSRRVQVPKGQVLVRQGDVMPGLIVVISGELVKVEKPQPSQTYPRFSVAGLEQLHEDEIEASFLLASPQNSEIMEVPKFYVMKIAKIRLKSQERESVMLRNRMMTEELTPPSRQGQRKEIIPAARVLMSSQARRMTQGRPLTSKDDENKRNRLNIRFATFYNNKNEDKDLSRRPVRTEGDEQLGGFRKTRDENYLRTEKDESKVLSDHISLGQMCLRRFLIRKQQRQNGQIIKYLKSGAPELQLNPSKQFAVVKPLHVSDSTYVKNLKRKMKRSYLKSGGPDMRDLHKRQTRCSFFFDDQSAAE